MTEAEWSGCSDPTAMLSFLGARLSKRKQRLFAVACCRRIWHLFVREESRQAVETAERYAEGVAAAKELGATHHLAIRAMRECSEWFHARAALAAADAAAGHLLWEFRNPGAPEHDPAFAAANAVSEYSRVLLRRQSRRHSNSAERREREMQSHLLRDVSGTPFRRPERDPAWLA